MGMVKENIKVAGVTFGKRQGVLNGLRKYTKSGKKADLVLVREASNKKDPNAIKVLIRWNMNDKNNIRRAQIGYVPAEIAKELAPVMDNGTFVKVKSFSMTDTKTVGIKMDLAWS